MIFSNEIEGSHLDCGHLRERKLEKMLSFNIKLTYILILQLPCRHLVWIFCDAVQAATDKNTDRADAGQRVFPGIHVEIADLEKGFCYEGGMHTSIISQTLCYKLGHLFVKWKHF